MDLVEEFADEIPGPLLQQIPETVLMIGQAVREDLIEHRQVGAPIIDFRRELGRYRWPCGLELGSQPCHGLPRPTCIGLRPVLLLLQHLRDLLAHLGEVLPLDAALDLPEPFVQLFAEVALDFRHPT